MKVRVINLDVAQTLALEDNPERGKSLFRHLAEYGQELQRNVEVYDAFGAFLAGFEYEEEITF